MTHNEGFKKAMVEKLLIPGGIGITALSKKTGIPRRTLFDWRKKYCSANDIDLKVTRSPRELPLLAKYEAILESTSLEEENFGRWLRLRGLKSEHLEKWKDEIRDMAKKKNKDDIKKNEELKEAKQRIKELERELRRKDKALAEASALILLKKKADAIWGVEEDSTIEKKERK